MMGSSGFENLAEYTKEPVTCHHFAKTTADVSTSATVRLTADPGTSPCNVYVSSLSYNAIVLTYNSSGYIEGVNYIVVNSDNEIAKSPILTPGRGERIM